MDEAERRPPAEAVQVTDDGLLHKLTLQEGTGEVPPKHARCLGERQCAGWRWRGAVVARRLAATAAARDRWVPRSPRLPAPACSQCTMWGG